VSELGTKRRWNYHKLQYRATEASKYTELCPLCARSAVTPTIKSGDDDDENGMNREMFKNDYLFTLPVLVNTHILRLLEVPLTLWEPG
jgi:hypothetical protein